MQTKISSIFQPNKLTCYAGTEVPDRSSLNFLEWAAVIGKIPRQESKKKLKQLLMTYLDFMQEEK